MFKLKSVLNWFYWHLWTRVRFIGMQEDGAGGSVPLYNIVRGGGAHKGSTWSAVTLKEHGIKIPRR